MNTSEYKVFIRVGGGEFSAYDFVTRKLIWGESNMNDLLAYLKANGYSFNEIRNYTTEPMANYDQN